MLRRCFLALFAGRTPDALFVAAWKRWQEAISSTPGTINAPEVIAWQGVKSAWRKLEKAADRYYRGE